MAAGPAAEERQGDDQEDSRTGRRTEEGGNTIRVGLKDGEFFFFCPLAPWAARGKEWGMEGQEGGEGKVEWRCGLPSGALIHSAKL